MFPECVHGSILRNSKSKKRKKKQGTTLWQQLLISNKEGMSRYVHSETDDSTVESSRLSACHGSRGTPEHTVTTLPLQRDDQRGAAPCTVATHETLVSVFSRSLDVYKAV